MHTSTSGVFSTSQSYYYVFTLQRSCFFEEQSLSCFYSNVQVDFSVTRKEAACQPVKIPNDTTFSKKIFFSFDDELFSNATIIRVSFGTDMTLVSARLVFQNQSRGGPVVAYTP